MALRLFVGLDLPADIKDALATIECALPGARPVPWDNYHLTLNFIGEVDEGMAEDVHEALATLSGPAFTLALAGIGQFETGGRARSIWAGVQAPQELRQIQGKITRMLRRLGAIEDTRRFTPHVTVARLRDAPPDRVARVIHAHSLFRTRPFEVREVTLFESTLGGEGALYEALAAYPLER